ncbi:MAG: MCE family protein [Saprospiraceae bacterium]|nr:MCE family protein [Saprospiraceae bacterium]
MAKKIIERVKLGIFVMAGLALLIFALFKLGQNRSLFSSTIELKTHFHNVGGLVAGNNIRFAGINVGAVKSVKIVNDTAIEVVMIMDDDVKNFIRKNARVSLGTDGIIGNRILNINPEKGDAPFVQSGDFLISVRDIDTDAMLRTLDRSNQNIAEITEDLQVTLRRFAQSPQLIKLLEDETMSTNIIQSFANIRRSTDEIHSTLADMRSIVEDVKAGEGSVGKLLRDTTLSAGLNEAVLRIQTLEDQAEKITHDIDSVVLNLNAVVSDIDQSVKGTDGPLGLMLNDSVTARQLEEFVVNLNASSELLKVNMEAMQSNFLLKGYFKDQEKAEKKARKAAEKKAKKAERKDN